MSSLSQQRGGFRTQITKLESRYTSEAVNNCCDEPELKRVLNKVEIYAKSIAELDGKILEKTVPEDLENFFEEQDLYLDKICFLRQVLIDRLNDLKASAMSQQHSSTASATGAGSSTGMVDQVRLPRIELPTFDGAFEDWQNFIEQFNSVVHNNPTLSDSVRFSYLLSLLRGDAKDCVDGLKLTSSDYKTARDLLQDRFGSPKKAIRRHMEALLNISISNQDLTALKVRNVYDELMKRTRCLESLGVQGENYSILLMTVILKNLPLEIVRGFAERFKKDDEETLENFLLYLKEFVDVLERSECFVSSQSKECVQRSTGSHAFSSIKTQRPKSPAFNKQGSASAPLAQAKGNQRIQGNRPLCPFDGQDHFPGACKNAFNFDPQRVKHLLYESHRCYQCMGLHKKSECKWKNRNLCQCSSCVRGNHQAMCEKRCSERKGSIPIPNPRQSVDNNRQVQNCTSVSTNTVSIGRSHHGALLQTATCFVTGSVGEKQIRLLLDSGSERSYCTVSLAQEVGFPRLGDEKLTIHGFGGTLMSRARSHPKFLVSVLTPCGDTIAFEALGTDRVCMPTIQVPPSVLQLPHIAGLQLADKSNEDDTISVLVGVDSYWKFFCSGEVRMGESDQPVAQQTQLGWVLSGPLPSGSLPSRRNVSNLLLLTSDDDLHSNLEKFWSMEQFGIGVNNEKTDSFMQKFEETIVYTGNRYEVQLPFKQFPPELSCNRQAAERRLNGLYRKLEHDKKLQSSYSDALDEFKQKGYTELVSPTDADSGFFLPHHPVVRKSESSYRVRPVFDASCKDSRGVSLNDCLEVGPNLLPDLPAVLLRFRKHPIGFVSDIERAFLQVQIAPEHRQFLRYLWKSSHDSEVQTYQFLRLPFGVCSAPTILAATIKTHLRSLEHTEAVSDLLQNLYVDDWVSCGVDEETVLDRCRLGYATLRSSGMKLRKWASNSATVLFHLQNDGMEVQHGSHVSVLGLDWDLSQDTLSLNSPTFVSDTPATMRSFASFLFRIFDPLGMASPVSTAAKIALQEMWRRKLAWDVLLPDDLIPAFRQLKDSLTRLSSISIPRFMAVSFLSNLQRSMEFSLHLFCDASEKAFGSVVYLRVSSGKQVSVNFVISKARVSPLKKVVTLPRLELCSCVLGARLLRHLLDSVFSDLDIPCYGWTDSMIALGWIQRNFLQWKDYVSNRVKEVQTLVPKVNWRHCSGITNPADRCSRGCSFQSLSSSVDWWHGPEWLCRSADQWPSNITEEVVLPVEEFKLSSPVLVTTSKPVDSILSVSNFASFHRLTRVTGWVLRFARNIREPSMAKSERQQMRDSSGSPPDLELDELQSAELFWIRLSQLQHYPSEYHNLKNGRRVPSTSKILLLRPIWSHLHEVMFTSGREERDKALVIVPPSDVAESLLRECHENKVCHAGPEATLAHTRLRHWIVHGRKLAKKVVHECRVCRRYQGTQYLQLESALPSVRVSEAKPFHTTGVDFAGPFYTREGKAHLCLFSCAVTRALHVELVEDLSTPVFILALRRFVAQRSCCKTIICDNALTFKKASGILQDVSFKFIPEKSPWWGGFYERMVKSVKSSLKKVLGRSCLRFRELETITKEVACAINHRPLTMVSSEICDGSPLTPAHFLDGSPPNHIEASSPNFTEEPFLLPKFQRRQKLLQLCWSRWRTQYLQSLHQWRTKGNASQSAVHPKIGDVVIVDCAVRNRKFWPLARVVRLIPGADGVVRVVEVRKSDGTILKRCTKQVFPLEVNTQCSSDDSKVIGKDAVVNRPGRTVGRDAKLSKRNETKKSSTTSTITSRGRIVTAPLRYSP